MDGNLRKRNASRSPSNARPQKRAMTSSPEEGELDDASSPPPPMSLPLSLPARPEPYVPAPPSKAKVPFPFKNKKKPEPARGSPLRLSDNFDRAGPAVYERSEEDARKIRESDAKRRNPRPAKITGDHWEPDHSGSGRYYTASRHYPPGADRDRDSYRDRDRRQASPPSRSPVASRSPSSPSSYREKHRLPAPRLAPSPRGDSYVPSRRSPRRGDTWTNQMSYSPPQRDYGLDRVSDRVYSDRDRERGWDHDDRGNGRRGDEKERGRRGDDDREWTRRDDDGFVRTRTPDRRYDPTRGDSYRPVSPPPGDSYRPVSPSDDSYRPMSPPPGPSPPPAPQSNGENGTPPPPLNSPPPAPPPDARLAPSKPISISLPKRPGAPLDKHTPPSMPLPATMSVARDQKPKDDMSLREKVARAQPRRRAPRRSRKEEERVYGRTFVGCGEQLDYSVTTKLGEGTFGEVHKAIHKRTNEVVALKRILMHNEKEGMPVTALREIKILKALNHPCIVNLLDMFVVRSNGKDPLSVYMVFPYMDHDLAGLLENERVKLQPSHIKLYMKQLLEGTEYMHRNCILHRDMKAANLLISNNGCLKIADFGLARAFDPNITRGGTAVLDARGKERRYTNCVVTRWYRPPELLMGARQYGGEVDMWGIGCVLGEMFMRRPILPGTSDLDQLEKIWKLCGTPNQHSWPNYDALPGCEGVKRFNDSHPRRVKSAYDTIGPETVDLLDKLLICNPQDRITASEALDHPYFWSDPLPADPKTLPSYEASHEFDRRGHRNPPPAGPPPAHHRHHDGPGPGQFRQRGGHHGGQRDIAYLPGPPPLHFGGGPGPGPPGIPPHGLPPNPNHYHNHNNNKLPYPPHLPPPPMPMQYGGNRRGPHDFPHGGRFPPPPAGPYPGQFNGGHRGGGGGGGGGYRQEPRHSMPRPSHLPPRPSMPQGAGLPPHPGPPPMQQHSAPESLNYG
ncbi:hypothetical protein HGRIS_000295 [Hohenbuehelia grisea]|uniref:Protein kinase domain-containing protein n=1 Tax=Hohenbuehelia grisea TaxID=104357 RepID=A0ABR3JS03_9AGAR